MFPLISDVPDDHAQDVYINPTNDTLSGESWNEKKIAVKRNKIYPTQK